MNLYKLIITRPNPDLTPQVDYFTTLTEARKALQTERKFLIGEALLEIRTHDNRLMLNSSLHSVKNCPRKF